MLAAVPTAFSIEHDGRHIEVVPFSSLSKDRLQLLVDGDLVAEVTPNGADTVVAGDGVEVRVVMPWHGVSITRAELGRYRMRYMEELLQQEHGEFSELDRQVVESIARQDTISENSEEEFEEHRTFADRVSDNMAAFGGSWWFQAVAVPAGPERDGASKAGG